MRPDNANLRNSSFPEKTLFNTLYPVNKNINTINKTKIAPNSSEITAIM